MKSEVTHFCPRVLEQVEKHNLVTPVLQDLYPLLVFEILEERLLNKTFEVNISDTSLAWISGTNSYYRAVNFFSDMDNRTPLLNSESFLALKSAGDYELVDRLKTANQPLGSFLLHYWLEQELMCKTICLKTIEIEAVPPIFTVTRDASIILRQRLISVANVHEFLVQDYFTESVSHR